MTAANTLVNKSYSALVSAARDLARDGLRTRNIRTQVEVIAGLNLEKSQLVSEAKDAVKGYQHSVDGATYRLAKQNLEVALGDPDFADKVKHLEENLACEAQYLAETTEHLAKLVAGTTDCMVELNKQIKEAEEKIGRWESGENKVQLSNLDALAKEYIEAALAEKAGALSKVLG